MTKMNKKTKETRVRYVWIKHSLEDFLTINESFQPFDREDMHSLCNYILFEILNNACSGKGMLPFFRLFSLKTFVECVCQSPETAFKGTAVAMAKHK